MKLKFFLIALLLMSCSTTNNNIVKEDYTPEVEQTKQTSTKIVDDKPKVEQTNNEPEMPVDKSNLDFKYNPIPDPEGELFKDLNFKWVYESEYKMNRYLGLHNGVIIVASTEGSGSDSLALTGLDSETGKELWSVQGGNPRISFRCKDGLIYIADIENGKCICLDIKTGVEKWSSPIKKNGQLELCILGDYLELTHPHKDNAIDRIVWNRFTGDIIDKFDNYGDIYICNGEPPVIYNEDDNTLIGLDKETFSPIWEINNCLRPIEELNPFNNFYNCFLVDNKLVYINYEDGSIFPLIPIESNEVTSEKISFDYSNGSRYSVEEEELDKLIIRDLSNKSFREPTSAQIRYEFKDGFYQLTKSRGSDQKKEWVVSLPNISNRTYRENGPDLFKKFIIYDKVIVYDGGAMYELDSGTGKLLNVFKRIRSWITLV